MGCKNMQVNSLTWWFFEITLYNMIEVPPQAFMYLVFVVLIDFIGSVILQAKDLLINILISKQYLACSV